jgi:hypothetical protein
MRRMNRRSLSVGWHVTTDFNGAAASGQTNEARREPWFTAGFGGWAYRAIFELAGGGGRRAGRRSVR